MYQLLVAPVKRRLVLRSGPVAQLHDYALIYWFRVWLAEEHYRGCAVIVRELRARELRGQLPVSRIVDGLRDTTTGQPDLTGLNGLLDAWPGSYPALFSKKAGRKWLRRRRLYAAPLS